MTRLRNNIFDILKFSLEVDISLKDDDDIIALDWMMSYMMQLLIYV